MSSYGYASRLPLTCSSMFGPAFFLNDDQESVTTEFLRIRGGTGSDDCGRNIRARSEYSETRARVYSPFVKRWISPVLKEKFQAHPSLCRRSFDASARTSRWKWITNARSEASNLLALLFSLALVTSRLLKVSLAVALKASDKKKSFGIMVIR